jgi:hypothetical protein
MKPRRTRSTSWISIGVAAIAVAWLSGCCSNVRCIPCQPAGIYLTVLDDWTQMVQSAAKVSIAGKPCQPASVKGSAVYICSVPAGTYSIDIEQPGYTPTQVMFALEAEWDGCCLCGPIAYGSASIVPVETM